MRRLGALVNGEQKTGIRRRIIISMTVISASAVACGIIAILSILDLKALLDAALEQGGINAGPAIEEVGDSAYIFCLIIFIVIVIAAIFSIQSIISLSNRIQKPLDALEKLVYVVTRTGSLRIPDELARSLKKYADEGDDEISNLINSINIMIDGLVQKVAVLELVA